MYPHVEKPLKREGPNISVADEHRLAEQLEESGVRMQKGFLFQWATSKEERCVEQKVPG